MFGFSGEGSDSESSATSLAEEEAGHAVTKVHSAISEDEILNSADDVRMGQMFASMCSEKEMNSKRALCVSMMSLLAAKRQRRVAVVSRLILTNLNVMDRYISFRGGCQAVELYEVSGEFDIEAYGVKETMSTFRFSQEELDRLVVALGIPKVFRTSEGDKCDGLAALCMVCMYYAFPTRRFEMIKKFGCSLSKISRVISGVRQYLFDSFYPGMSKPQHLSTQQLQEFCNAIEKVCGVKDIFGFIDGTVRPTCKPEVLQAVAYNGSKHTHALKYQMLCTPDGMMRHVSGPYCGSRHDQHMVHKSEVLHWVLGHPRTPEGKIHSIYGDAGYAIAPGLMRPYPDGAVNILHEALNQNMTSARVCVEWEFGDIVQHWAHLCYKPGQKVLSGSRPGQQYIVAALLSNCQNCLHRGNTSTYFGCVPPTLEQYLDSLRVK